MTNWGDKNIAGKTEWDKRSPYKGATQGVGVQDSQHHLGDGKYFTFGYDGDWLIGYSGTRNVLEIRSKDDGEFFSLTPDGRLVLPPSIEAPTASTGSLSSIFTTFGQGDSSDFQLHQSKGATEWCKVINEGDIVSTAEFSANNGDEKSVPSVRAVKDAILTAGVSNTVAAASDTDIATPTNGHMMIYDEADSKWHNKQISGDIAILPAGVSAIAADAVSYAQMQNVSGTDMVLGRSSSGAGIVEEIPCTSNGRTLLAAASMSSFDWHKYGSFSVHHTFHYKSGTNTQNVTYAMTPNYQSAIAVTSPPTFPTTTAGCANLFLFPAAGRVEGVGFTLSTSDGSVTAIYLTLYEVDLSSANDTSTDLVATAIASGGTGGTVTQNNIYVDNYPGLNHAVSEKTGLLATIKTVGGSKPDVRASFTITGRYL